jgi:hypothetical protein
MLQNDGRFWILLIVLPFFALIPDITIYIWQKVLFPNPTDTVLVKQLEEPSYKYQWENDKKEEGPVNDIK